MEINILTKIKNIFSQIHNIQCYKQIISLKILDYYLLRLFCSYLFSCFLLIFIMFIMMFFYNQLNTLLERNVNILTIIKLAFYISISVIPYIIPISILISSFITFLELSTSKELVIIQSSGISLLRVMRPIILCTCIISIGLYIFHDIISLDIEKKIKKIGYKIAEYNVFCKSLKEGQFINILPNTFIYIDKEINKRKLKNVFIFSYEINSGKLIVKNIFSKQGMITYDNNKYIYFKLFNGIFYIEYNPNKNSIILPYQILKFSNIIQIVNIHDFEKNYNKYMKYEYYMFYSTKKIVNRIRSLKIKYHFLNIKQKKSVNKLLYKLQVNLQKNLTYLTTCFIMLFIGSYLGIIINENNIEYIIYIGLILFTIYDIINIIINHLLEKEKINPFFGPWIPNIIFFNISIFMIYKIYKR